MVRTDYPTHNVKSQSPIRLLHAYADKDSLLWISKCHYTQMSYYTQKKYTAKQISLWTVCMYSVVRVKCGIIQPTRLMPVAYDETARYTCRRSRKHDVRLFPFQCSDLSRGNWPSVSYVKHTYVKQMSTTQSKYNEYYFQTLIPSMNVFTKGKQSFPLSVLFSSWFKLKVKIFIAPRTVAVYFHEIK